MCACAFDDIDCRKPAGMVWEDGCVWGKCGDGFINNFISYQNGTVNFDLIREDCDDGNVKDGDGCSSICRRESTVPCGNKVLDSGEECDDGNTKAGDGCSASCRLENTSSGRPPALRCGDGMVTIGEWCDDGSQCTDDPASCNRIPGTRGARCGCDPTNANCRLPAGVTVPSGCQWARCGDGTVNNLVTWNGARVNFDLIHEDCDDGNVLAGDGCSPVCQEEEPLVITGPGLPRPDPVSPLCGNRNIDPGEECDDGNKRNGDACSMECLLENGFCGDDVVQKLLGEQCEAALHDPSLPYTCGADCRFFSPFCGNGTLDPGEQCDDGVGNADSPDRCHMNCSLPRCGDNMLDASEQCDDGNRRDGDGCDRYCRTGEVAASSVPGMSLSSSSRGPILGPDGKPIIDNPPVGDTGPEVLVFMAAGAAAGYAWMRRKKK
jgi:cysteine-rich repeat protein